MSHFTLSFAHCRTWRRKYALYGLTFSSSLLSQTTSTFFKQRRTLKKKIAAKLKSIFCSIRYSKPSTFFEGSYSFWFGNSRFKICDEWPFRYFKIFQSLSLQDATRHRMINHCDQTSGRFRELRGWTFDLTSNCHRCWGIAPWQSAWWHRAVHRAYQISQSAFAKPRHSPGLNSFSRSGRPFGYAKEQHRLLGVH